MTVAACGDYKHGSPKLTFGCVLGEVLQKFHSTVAGHRANRQGRS